MSVTGDASALPAPTASTSALPPRHTEAPNPNDPFPDWPAVLAHMHSFHDSYSTKRDNVRILEAALKSRAGALATLSDDWREIYAERATVHDFYRDFQNIKARRAYRPKLMTATSGEKHQDVHNKGFKKDAFMEDFLNGQGRDIAADRSESKRFVAIETMAVPFEGTAGKLRWSALDAWHAERGLIGFPYQFSTFASPAGGYTSFHTDHTLLGYLLHIQWGYKIWISFVRSTHNNELWKRYIRTTGIEPLLALLEQLQGLEVTLMREGHTYCMPPGAMHMVLSLTDSAVSGWPIYRLAAHTQTKDIAVRLLEDGDRNDLHDIWGNSKWLQNLMGEHADNERERGRPGKGHMGSDECLQACRQTFKAVKDTFKWIDIYETPTPSSYGSSTEEDSDLEYPPSDKESAATFNLQRPQLLSKYAQTVDPRILAEMTKIMHLGQQRSQPRPKFPPGFELQILHPATNPDYKSNWPLIKRKKPRSLKTGKKQAQTNEAPAAPTFPAQPELDHVSESEHEEIPLALPAVLTPGLPAADPLPKKDETAGPIPLAVPMAVAVAVPSSEPQPKAKPKRRGQGRQPIGERPTAPATTRVRNARRRMSAPVPEGRLRLRKRPLPAFDLTQLPEARRPPKKTRVLTRFDVRGTTYWDSDLSDLSDSEDEGC